MSEKTLDCCEWKSVNNQILISNNIYKGDRTKKKSESCKEIYRGILGIMMDVKLLHHLNILR